MKQFFSQHAPMMNLARKLTAASQMCAHRWLAVVSCQQLMQIIAKSSKFNNHAIVTKTKESL